MKVLIKILIRIKNDLYATNFLNCGFKSTFKKLFKFKSRNFAIKFTFQQKYVANFRSVRLEVEGVEPKIHVFLHFI